MLFNSAPFLIFLPALLALYFLLPHRFRWVLMLAASYFFYGYWKVEYLALIITSTIVDYFAARYIHRSTDSIHKKIGLAVSLFTNLGLLAVFKYAHWFMADVLHPISLVDENGLASFRSFWDFALPVGISFYTFQTIGYTIDVYYGKTNPENNPFKFALFVSFFPQLVAGPIERFGKLHPQLFEKQRFSHSNLQHGGRLILYGLFVKMCVADNVGPIVDQLFVQSENASQLQLLLGALLFGLQIYSDFHGYSLIAIGCARLFGIHLMDNFNAPYTSLTIREFWSRWHISLSTWFRDYLYIPLGGNRAGQAKLAVNILTVFVVSGLWHGANWTFVAWGAIHGAAYLLERILIPKNPSKWLQPIQWLYTTAVVFMAWVFFRSDSISDATNYIHRMVSGNSTGIDIQWDPLIISWIGLFLISDIHFKNSSFHVWLNGKNTAERWAVYALLLLGIMGFAGTVQHPFIYFQF